MASQKFIGVMTFVLVTSLFLMAAVGRDIEKSRSDIHAGSVRSCHKYCSRRCCTEEEIQNLEHNSKATEGTQKPDVTTMGNNNVIPTNRIGGGSHDCYKHCGRHCCTEEELRDLEQNIEITASESNHHGGGGHGCYKYCGNGHCCTEEEISNTENHSDVKPDHSEVQN